MRQCGSPGQPRAARGFVSCTAIIQKGQQKLWLCPCDGELCREVGLEEQLSYRRDGIVPSEHYHAIPQGIFGQRC